MNSPVLLYQIDFEWLLHLSCQKLKFAALKLILLHSDGF